MAPTLKVGTVLLVNKRISASSSKKTFFRCDLRVNDIIVFQTPVWNISKRDSGVSFVKRCVGLPGDTIVINHRKSSRKFEVMDGQETQMFLFPQDTLFRDWTSNQYGPFWIPKKGSTISLTEYNLRLYKKLLLYENPKLRISNDSILLGSNALKEYTFQQDYYFMLGDNFQQSRDSRYWGCVPKDLLLGKVVWHF